MDDPTDPLAHLGAAALADLADCFPVPLGLGAPAALVLADVPAGAIEGALTALGRPAPSTKPAALATLVHALGDADAVRRDAAAWAAARGLVVAPSWGYGVEVPAEVALALRGPGWTAPRRLRHDVRPPEHGEEVGGTRLPRQEQACLLPCLHACVQQVTWRAEDDLVDRVRSAAADRGRSLNDFVTRVLDAATDPGLEGDEVQRHRERLARAGLLAPAGASRRRPDPQGVALARARAGRGTPLSDVVARDRG